MTGGGKLVQLADGNGSLIDVVNSPVTNGYELHCDGTGSNNLEVNNHDPNGPHFHLDILQSANCFTMEGNQNPPSANFDTFWGFGSGKYSVGNQSTNACAEWAFTDGQGSPQNNKSYIHIAVATATDSTVDLTVYGCPARTVVPGLCKGATLIDVPYQTPLNGQNQAHK